MRFHFITRTFIDCMCVCVDLLRETEIPLFTSVATVTFLDSTAVKRKYALQVGPPCRGERPTRLPESVLAKATHSEV
jgi:hypothetical protein